MQRRVEAVGDDLELGDGVGTEAGLAEARIRRVLRYLQTIQIVFKEHQLPRGVWVSRGRQIDPSAIETALMTVEGELDDISGVGQTKAAHALTPNIPGARHVHWEQPRVGHYGIFNGRKWREQIMPRVRDFIRDNEAA